MNIIIILYCYYNNNKKQGDKQQASRNHFSSFIKAADIAPYCTEQFTVALLFPKRIFTLKTAKTASINVFQPPALFAFAIYFKKKLRDGRESD